MDLRRWFPLALSIGLLALAGCAGRREPAPTPTPTPEPQKVEVSCEAFRLLAFPGLPLPLPSFLREHVPSPQITGASSPTSGKGKQADDLMRGALEQVAGPTRAGCFVEVKAEEGPGWGMWGIYQPTGEVDASRLADALKQKGASGVETFSVATPTGPFGLVSFQFPLEGQQAFGALILVGPRQVIGIAGLGPAGQAEKGEGSPTPTPTYAAPAGPQPTPTSEAVSILPEPVAQADDFFRPLVESATGLTLSLEDYTFWEQESAIQILITYGFSGKLRENHAKALADALKKQGAQMVQVSGGAEGLGVTFAGLPYEGRNASGYLKFSNTRLELFLLAGGAF